jgi:hypothetical protein
MPRFGAASLKTIEPKSRAPNPRVRSSKCLGRVHDKTKPEKQTEEITVSNNCPAAKVKNSRTPEG